MQFVQLQQRVPLRMLGFGTAIMLALWLMSWIFSPPPPPPPPPPPFFPIQEPVDSPLSPAEAQEWSERATLVKNAFAFAYNGYRDLAFGWDEVKPTSGKPINNFNGWGVSIYDGLDTMLLMGLDDMFDEAMDHISNTTYELPEKKFAPYFETVIRYLGGLLSAYALSHEPILLARADDLGKALLMATNTTSGLPAYGVNTVTGKTKSGWAGASVLFAEALSCQMEYKYLAHLTGRQEYYHKVEHIMKVIFYDSNYTGLYPSTYSAATGLPTNFVFSVGSAADSGYEYLLKQWLLTGQSEPKIRDLYVQSANAILAELTFITPTRQLLYVTDATRGHPSHNLEHLTCFLGGLLALGAATLPPDALTPTDRARHAWAAEGLTHTCWATYADTPTGLGPDGVSMTHYAGADEGRWLAHVERWERAGRPGGKPPGVHPAGKVEGKEDLDYRFKSPAYLLRPETIESVYIMWRTTRDPIWRERGWELFLSIEKWCKTTHGYTVAAQIQSDHPRQTDEQPSWFFAETLKYLYLLFSEEDLLPLDKWVFNTEAHPLPVFHWRKWEKEAYGIPL
ncbi:glycoside hydrolase [Schizophyllum amplum]|uniref:alpha-1,2-Mannosidase n=1 Tax=Schizophyllum amplum TaxID=97359 RepID=A0A550CDB9_9AGAR|nr:glycoside hydrolase [Auriculariopsis ampla]